jgi:hypothetical protein
MSDSIERWVQSVEISIQPRSDFEKALLARLLTELDGQSHEDVPTEGTMESSLTQVPDLNRPLAAVRESPASGEPGAWLQANFISYVAIAAVMVIALAGGLIATVSPRHSGLVTTSTPEVEVEVISSAWIESIPDTYTQTYTGIDRIILASGQQLESGPDTAYGDGVYLFKVEAGPVYVTFDGSAAVKAGGASNATPVASTEEVSLQAGDTGIIWPGTMAIWRNDGTQPVVVLNAAIGEAVDVQIDYEQETILKSLTIGWPQLPATFSFLRLTFAPGASLSAEDLPGLMLLAPEDGEVTVPLLNADGTSRDRSFTPGDGFVASDWNLDTNGQFSNSGTNSVIVYVLLGQSDSATDATPTD